MHQVIHLVQPERADAKQEETIIMICNGIFFRVFSVKIVKILLDHLDTDVTEYIKCKVIGSWAQLMELNHATYSAQM